MGSSSPSISADDSKIQQVYTAASEILADAPEGMRFVDLIRQVRARGIDFGALGQYIQWLPRRNPERFSKPSRGVFILTENLRNEDVPAQLAEQLSPAALAADQIREQAFYQSFAAYLTDDLEECTRAVALGGNTFGGKWGTPDVIGLTLAGPRDIYRAPLELLSAEIKVVGGRELVTAFGQACSYQLFSHKTYIVVAYKKDAEIDRLEALCQTFGIGLVLFNAENPSDPRYSLRMRAIRREPDRFFINETLTHACFDGLLGV